MKKLFEDMLVEMLNKKARIDVAPLRRKIEALEKEMAEAKKELEVHEKDLADFCAEFNYELVEGNVMKSEPSLYLKKVVKKRAAKK